MVRVTAEQALAVRQDLPQQGFAHRRQVNQVNRPPARCRQQLDQLHLLRHRQRAIGLHGDIQIAVQARATAPDSVAPFIDPDGYRAYVDSGEARYRRLLAEQQAGR